MFYEIYPHQDDRQFARDLEAALKPTLPNVPIEGAKLMVAGVELRYNAQLGRWFGSFRQHLAKFPITMTRWSCNLVRIIKLDHPGLNLDEGPYSVSGGCTVYVENTAGSTHIQIITVEAPTHGEANRLYNQLILGHLRLDGASGLDAERTSAIRDAAMSILRDDSFAPGHEAKVLARVILRILGHPA